MWFLCQRRDAKPRSGWTVTRDVHLAWMKARHDEGVIVMSGPAPRHGMSMYLIRATSAEAAAAIATADPFTASGQCTYELIEWDIHQILGAGMFTDAGLAAQAAKVRTDESGRAAAGPHASPRLTDAEKTPGAGTLATPGEGLDQDSTSG